MSDNKGIRISLVRSWNADEIVDLYRTAGWWKEEYDPADIPRIIEGSFGFAVAVDTGSRRAIGMGRAISDGISDAYLQDLITDPRFRGRGIGKSIVSMLVEHCKKSGISWIGIIAEPDSEKFYLPLGFERMDGYLPMIYRGDR
jgi:ribosomal protein S18 acetylase RimI-like enzyme